MFVGGGNNHAAVRQIVRRRIWWHRERQECFVGSVPESQNSDEEDSAIRGAHFVWT